MKLKIYYSRNHVALILAVVFLLCFGEFVQAEQYCASVSGSISGRSCYATKHECDGAVATAKREQGSGSAFQYTDCTSDGAGATAGSSGDSSGLISKGVENTMQGVMSGDVNLMGAGAAEALFGMLLEGSGNNSAATNQQAAQQQAAQQQAAQQQAIQNQQRAIEAENRHQQLMSKMMPIDSSPSSSAPKTKSNNELGLMMLDDEPVQKNSKASRPSVNTGGVAVGDAKLTARDKIKAGNNTNAGEQLKSIQKHSTESLAGNNETTKEESGKGFDTSGNKNGALMDGAHAPIAVAVDMSSQREQAIAKNPGMIQVTEQINELQAEQANMDIEIERLTKERGAEQDKTKMQEKTIELDKQNKKKQELNVEISKKKETKEKLYTMLTELGTEPTPIPKEKAK